VCFCACSTDSEFAIFIWYLEIWNAIRQISPESLCNSDNPFALSHLTCSAAVFGHDTKSSLTKLHVTAVSYREQQLIQYVIPLQYVEFNRKQQHVQQPSQIRFPEVLQPYNNNNCVCVRVCVCDRRRFCIYHAVYRLCPGYGKSFIPHAFLCTR
jgi:hypothetical protein